MDLFLRVYALLFALIIVNTTGASFVDLAVNSPGPTVCVTTFHPSNIARKSAANVRYCMGTRITMFFYVAAMSITC